MTSRTVLLLVIAVLGWTLAMAASAGAQSGTVTMSATVNGQDVATATGTQPVALHPDEWAEIQIDLTNTGTQPVDIRRVTLTGSVLGLTFFSYATTVDLAIAPGATETLTYRLDLTDLDGQATGLIGAELSVSDADRVTLAAIATVTDVRGSLMSVYGLFGIALAVLTALSLLDLALAIARHRMSTNRFQRGLRCLAPGVGIGLVLVFSASAARLWVPDLGLWMVIASLAATFAFAVGYFSPTPDDDDFDDDDFDDTLDEDADAETVISDRGFR